MKKPKPTRRNIELKKLFASKAYKEWLTSVKEKYEEFGVPLPTEPIPEPTCICHQEGWYKEVNDKVAESQNSPELKKALDTLRDENGKIEGHEKVQKAYDFQEKYTLEPIGMYIDYLVCTHMNIDRFKDVKDREIYSNFIRKKILHGTDEYVSPVVVSHRPHGIGKHQEKALWLKIEPEMTKADVEDVWNFVKQWQKNLPDYKERYKQYPNLKRDVRIMDIYNEIKESDTKKTEEELKPLPSVALRVASQIESEGFDEIFEETVNKIVSQSTLPKVSA